MTGTELNALSTLQLRGLTAAQAGAFATGLLGTFSTTSLRP